MSIFFNVWFILIGLSTIALVAIGPNLYILHPIPKKILTER